MHEEMLDEMTPMCELARKYHTDKGGVHTFAGETCHRYTPAYYAMWKDRREEVKNVLEIGVNYGGSLHMWRDFFPNAWIWGLDSNAACLRQENRITCLAADQGSEASLVEAMCQISARLEQRVRFDFIVDDGSHEEHHQVLSANTLIPYLEDDGRYVIEDIEFDCDPIRYLQQIRYRGWADNVGIGIGKAHCVDHCTRCNGKGGERLLVFSKHG